MNVTHQDLWTAYRAVRKNHDRLAERAGIALSIFAGRNGGLHQITVDAMLLPVRAAHLEAEQLYREYDAMATAS